MDDRYFFSMIVYLVIVIGASGFLPDSFYSGTHHDNLNSAEFKETFSGEISQTETFSGQLSFFSKVITLLFVTWTIDGIPLFFSLIIFFLNIISITVPIIYIYDKIRGI